MERSRHQVIRPCIVVVLLGLVALSCCIAAEFKKAKDRDIKLDGSLCSMPRRPAFGLGITALTCLFISQIVGTSSSIASSPSSSSSSSKEEEMEMVCIRINSKRHHALSITLLILSWISFVSAAVLLVAATSMNNRQEYSRGWTDGECYVVKGGIFTGAAILTAANIIFIIGFFMLKRTREMMTPRQTSPDIIDDEERIDSQQQQHKMNKADDTPPPE